MQAQKTQSKLAKLDFNSIKDYDWGSSNKESSVGRFSKHLLNRYAELWIGTHTGGCSKLNQNISLTDYLKSIGLQNLNFLFKILSIQRCLSIQVHPNKQQAISLNSLDANTYKDDNDKPEMFLTISQEFQAFLGFINQQQLQKVPSFSVFSPYQQKQINQGSFCHKQKILKIIRSLLEMTQNQIEQKVVRLLNQEKQNLIKMERLQLIQRLQKQFPYDIGILISCFLNYKKLPNGSCFGIPAGVPHAYIKGQCFQLMNNSDNVVRLGLTPKKKDSYNVLKILTQNLQNNLEQVKILKQIKDNFRLSKYNWRQFQIMDLNVNYSNKTTFQNQPIKNAHIQINIKNVQECIQLEFQSLGIVFQGSFTFYNVQNSQEQQKGEELICGQVFHLLKGKFVFQGKGRILLSLVRNGIKNRYNEMK